ncbi:MBL fold metallo-hydrolase [Halomonas jincaotanensis]|uniref:MBL fold metallo-hydrolase n=1 Tax=Halomonas jincaotanensis TaxID=2810616 RepID=UPI0029E81CD7|nr:MBL fold metallo-hydrolase [Halomonas jincaotanensis]
MNAYPTITHHGGAEGVTGSCHRLQLAADRALLVDCGLFQGEDAQGDDSLAQHRVTFPVDDVLALLVTHVHIDHIGRLPYLLAAGYQGPILCSVPSARLLPLVIEDALKIGFTGDRALPRRGGRAPGAARLRPVAHPGRRRPPPGARAPAARRPHPRLGLCRGRK